VSTTTILLPATLGGVALLGTLLVAARGRWDLLLGAARDGIRHALAAVLMLGTLAGTVWTFSAGRLSLSGAWERIVSVGGVAAALECGVIYTGWYIGELDQRIQSARRREVADQFRALQRSLYRWFYAVASISAAANFVFRLQQLGNPWLAAFVSIAPIVLVILFCIKLRALPVDYQEVSRRATQRGLVVVTQESQRVLLRGLRDMGRGRTLSEQRMTQLAMASALLRAHARPEEALALQDAIDRGTGGLVAVDAEGSESWLSTQDIAGLYGVPLRTAQHWVASAPGRRKAPQGRAWLAPTSAILAQHGRPRAVAAALPAPKRKRQRAQPGADETPTSPELALVALPFGAEQAPEITEPTPITSE
jgi:hypothetical protein